MRLIASMQTSLGDALDDLGGALCGGFWALLCMGIFALTLGAPAIALTLRKIGREGGELSGHIIRCALVNTIWVGIVFASLGFALGVTLPDETGGEGAIFLGASGLLAGGLLGGIMSALAVFRLGRDRR